MQDERLGLASASGFAADVLCHGRRNLIRSMNAQGVMDIENAAPSEYAERGTRIHKAMEVESDWDLKDAGERDAYLACRNLKLVALRAWYEDNDLDNRGGATEMPREMRLWLHHPDTLAPLLSGQQDAHWVSNDGRDVLCVDFKSGRADHMEDANVNWQLRCAALLTWLEYDRKAERVRVEFIKPEAFAEQLDYADFTRYDLENIERATYHHLWQIAQPDAKLHAGEHCRWCVCKSTCPEALRYATAPIQSLQIVPAENGKITKKYAAQLVSIAPIESVREVFGKRAVIGYVLDAVAARLRALPPEEKYRLALKMNLGRSGDYIRDTKAAFDALLASGLFEEADLWRCVKLSKTELAALYQRIRNCRDSEADVWYENAMDQYIERKRGDEILAEV